MVSVQLVFLITIPANTAVLTKIKGSIKHIGKLTKLFIDIPSGWDYTAGLQIRVGKNHQLPYSPHADNEEVFTGDDIYLSLNPNVDVQDEEITVYGLNSDSIQELNKNDSLNKRST